MPDRPHIIYLNSHDTGRYIEPYGYAVPTPNLMDLARQGVLFRNAFCANPTCSPSRACLLTGQWPRATGMTGLAHRGFSLAHPERHLAHTLRAAGYRTEQIGIQHVVHGPDEHVAQQCGFDRRQGGRADAVVQLQRVLDEHRAAGAAGHGQPLYLEMGFFETHRPFPQPAPADDARYCRPPAPLPDTPEMRADFAAFRTMARSLDAAYGRVMQLLRDYGIWDDALVICTTDHGIAFPFMKCNLTDHGIGVLLIVKGPRGSQIGCGTVTEAMASHVDLYPTVCELARIEPPAWLDGISLVPVLRNPAAEVRQALFAEVNYHAAYEPMRAVRTSRYKYIRRFDNRTQPTWPNCDNSPAKQQLADGGWAAQPRPAEMLFDLRFDPNEANNLIGRRDTAPDASAALVELRARLDDYMKQTDDPLRHGPIPAPADAVVTPPDNFDPDLPRT